MRAGPTERPGDTTGEAPNDRAAGRSIWLLTLGMAFITAILACVAGLNPL